MAVRLLVRPVRLTFGERWLITGPARDRYSGAMRAVDAGLAKLPWYFDPDNGTFEGGIGGATYIVGWGPASR